MMIKVYHGGWTSVEVRKTKTGRYLGKAETIVGVRDMARRMVRGMNADCNNPQVVTAFGDCLPIVIVQ